MPVALDISELQPLNPLEEFERLNDLRSLEILDTPAEDRFDRITRLAAEFFKVPIAYVAFIDNERQWFKSRHGMCPAETSRSISFCQYTIQRNEPFIMPDARLHPLGRQHPMVTGEPFLRFYAGVPLTGPRGQKIGTFCLVDLEPRHFTADQIAHLTVFAAIVEREMNLGQIIQTQNELLSTRQQLLESQTSLNRELTDAAKYVRLMLPPSLDGPEIIDWEFQPSTALGGDGLGYRRIDEDKIAFYVIDVTGHGLGSALLAVTVLEFLRSRMPRDIDFSRPSQVIDRVNRTFQGKDHAGKFFSAWYGVYSRSAGTIIYANAGHPPAVLVRHNKTKVTVTKTEPGGPVLGVFPDIQTPELTIPFDANSELFLFTDGIYELTAPEGGRASHDEFLAHLQGEITHKKTGWKVIHEWLDRARADDRVDDDVSLMRFTVRS